MILHQDYEGEIAMLQGVIRRLATDLIQIAELTMPNSYLLTDSRVKYAKECKTRFRKKKHEAM